VITAEVDEPRGDRESTLIAPRWHTGLMLLIFSVLPVVSAFRLKGEDHRAPPLFLSSNRELVYIAALVVEWGVFALVYMGLFLQKTPLSVLIGKTREDKSDLKRDIALGIGGAVLVFCSTATLVYLFGPFDPHDIDIYPKTAVQFYFFFLMLVSGGFTEEVIFRGYFLKQLKYFFKSDSVSVLLQALLFAIAHGLDESVPGIFNKFLTGLLFGYIAYKTNRLMPTIVAHCGLNAAAAILIFVK
jgi:membrane protease YdiL (CAAX protease family)